MVVKDLKPIMPVKSTVIIYTVNLSYVFIIKVINVDYKCYSYKIQNKGSNTLFLFFFHLLLYTLLLLNLLLKLK